MKLISKDKVVAELKRLISYSQNMGDNAINSSMQQFFDGMKEGYTDALSSIQSIETKEVDLEKEVRKFIKDNGTSLEEPDEFLTTLMLLDDMVMFAKHFFELGMQQSKNDNNNEEKK